MEKHIKLQASIAMTHGMVNRWKNNSVCYNNIDTCIVTTMHGHVAEQIANRTVHNASSNVKSGERVRRYLNKTIDCLIDITLFDGVLRIQHECSEAAQMPVGRLTDRH